MAASSAEPAASRLGSVESLLYNGTTIDRVFLQGDGTFPNNAAWPLLLYRQVFDETKDGDGAALLTANGWSRPWAWGVFTYHHYHSTAWEALLCVRGQADVQFGGPQGPTLTPSKGDLILIPPGVAHKQLASSEGFLLLGSYPDHDGCRTPGADTCRGAPSLQQAASIRGCPAPLLCPRWGAAPPWDGGLGALLHRREADEPVDADACSQAA